MATSQGDYTVIYITTPPSLENPSQQTHKQQIYEMEEELEFNFENSEHIELKRDFNLHIRAVDNTSLPLFETYQFLSPGRVPASRAQLRLMNWANVFARSVYGWLREPALDPCTLYWHQRDCGSRGVLYGVQQGDGSGCAEEAIMTNVSYFGCISPICTSTRVQEGA